MEQEGALRKHEGYRGSIERAGGKWIPSFRFDLLSLYFNVLIPYLLPRPRHFLQVPSTIKLIKSNVLRQNL